MLEAAIARYGAPEHLRSDNGPEFIANAIVDWLAEQSIKTIYITPGSPWENGHIESFHDKLRDECLNRELFGSLLEARIILESWRVECNTCARTARIATGHQTNMLSNYRTNLMGAARPQTPRRSPRQAFGRNGGNPFSQAAPKPIKHNRRTSVLNCPTCGIRSYGHTIQSGLSVLAVGWSLINM